MSEPWPEIPRLAEVYDVECAGRLDHDFYLALAAEVDAECVLDLGCGTGVFCVDVAAAGRRAIGIDPAEPMLAIARRRPGGDRVEWIAGDAAAAPTARAALVVMMGHVAQYFVDDEEWLETLIEIRRALRPGGLVTFESRNPRVDWAAEWTEARSRRRLPHPRGGWFESWVHMVDTIGEAGSHTSTHEGHTVLPRGGGHLITRETLRFRSRAEIEAALAAAGFAIEATWGGWDRSPLTDRSREMIFLARRDRAP